MRHDARDCHREDWAAEAEKDGGVSQGTNRGVHAMPQGSKSSHQGSRRASAG